MLESISNLLTHYANRVNTSTSIHPKGIQVSIAVMPCPLKVKDEALRQKLIQPIVVAGSVEDVMEQLTGLEESLNAALSNEDLNASVNAFNQTVHNAKASQKVPTAATAKPEEKTSTKSGDVTHTPPANDLPESSNPLSDFLT